MNEYNIMDNYVIFKDLGSDSIGNNFRAGEIEDNKPGRHRLLTVVHSFLATNPAVWKRIKILLEGIKKSNIPNLYSPEKIEVREDKTTLVYPLLHGKTFEQVLEDATKKNAPINFDLAFSIALAIADLIDTGSSIVVSGKKSFHGFLTPDNIIFDYDGKIFLKNYGIFPYLNHDDEIFTEMIKKYGAWTAPEFLRKEKPIPQSDIYHLGYIIYRMLTGNYFSCLPGEDFDAKFSNIAFTQHIHSSEKGFLTNIINFFKNTLNPDPGKRFANIREFKDFISNHFKIEELSSVTFSLAYFMNSLYLETIEEEASLLEKESAYVIPSKSEEQKVKDDSLIENILIGLEEKERARSKFLLIPIAIAAAAVAIAVFFYINMNKTKQARLDEINKLKQQEQTYLTRLQASADRTDQLQKEMDSIKEKITTTEDDKKAQQERLNKLQLEYQQRLKDEADIRQKIQDERKKRETVQDQLGIAKETTAAETKPVEPSPGEAIQPATEDRQTPLEQPKTTVGQVVPLAETTVKPEKISGENPGELYLLRKKYAGRHITVLSSILVNENGNVETIKILGSVPGDIKANVMETVKSWKFKAPQKDGVNVKAWIQKQFVLRFPKM